MYCPNCGKEHPDQSNFCDNCGSKLDHSVTSSEAELPEGIFLCEDGAYRWVYEVDLRKNNVIAGSLVKVTLIVILVILVPVLLMTGTDLVSMLLLIPAILVGAAVLFFIGYVLNALLHGGKYCAVFTMDEEKIVHAQTKKQVKKGRILAVISAVALNDPSTGITLLAAEKFTSAYRDVKSIEVEPAKDLIRVNETLVKNQIYVYPHQLEFVADYIISRCPNAVIKK